MKALVGGSTQRNAITAAIVSAAQASVAMTIPRSSPRTRPRVRFAIPPAARRALLRGCNAPGAGHDDRFVRHVVVTAVAAGLDRGDRVDDVHAVGDAAEYRVSRATTPRVEECVVDEVDEELRRRAVR